MVDWHLYLFPKSYRVCSHTIDDKCGQPSPTPFKLMLLKSVLVKLPPVTSAPADSVILRMATPARDEMAIDASSS